MLQYTGFEFQVNLQYCSPHRFEFHYENWCPFSFFKKDSNILLLSKNFNSFNKLIFPKLFSAESSNTILLYQFASILSNLQNMHFWTSGNYISEICSEKNHPRMTEAGRGKGFEELSAKSAQWPITQVWPLWLLATAAPVSHAQSRCFYYCRGHW